MLTDAVFASFGGTKRNHKLSLFLLNHSLLSVQYIMNFTKEDYKSLRVHFSVKMDASKLDLPIESSCTDESDDTTLAKQPQRPLLCNEDVVVAVVGNCEELGRWNPSKSLHLTCMNVTQPNMWQGYTVIRTQTSTPTPTPKTPQTPESPISASAVFQQIHSAMTKGSYCAVSSPSSSVNSMELSVNSSLPPQTIEYKYIVLRRVVEQEQEECEAADSQATPEQTIQIEVDRVSDSLNENGSKTPTIEKPLNGHLKTTPHMLLTSKGSIPQWELLRWETIVGNRKIQAPADALSIEVFDGEFGEIDVTKPHPKQFVDEGWLVDPNKIELRINLGTYQKYGSTPLKLYHPQYKDASFNIQMLLVNYPCKKGQSRRRFRAQLSRWVYENEQDTVGKPVSLHDEQIDAWKDGDIQIFSTYTSNLANKAVEVNILTTGPSSELIGKAIIIPQMVLPPMFNKEHSNLNNNRNGGHLNLPIIGVLNNSHAHDHDGLATNLTVIGELNCNYLIARPFEHPENNLSTLWRTHWLTNGKTLNIGHRGMGRSYRQVAPYPKATLTENTILSLVGAAQNGADFVEFDVHLTKDYVPVVYHDLTFSVDLKRAWSQDKHKGHNSYKENMEVSVHDLTLEQLRRVKTNPIPKHKHIFETLTSQLVDYWSDVLENQQQKQQSTSATGSPHRVNSPCKDKTKSSPTSTNYMQQEIARFKSLIEQVPTLEEALKAVPQHVGFNIEIDRKSVV